MKPHLRARRCRLGLPLIAALAWAALPAAAHDSKLGTLRIDHPYATPTAGGATQGAAYLRGIRNTGDQPDRLIGARTPVARAVEIHRGPANPAQAAGMRTIDGIDLPAGAELRLRHDGEHHLMLIGLKQPLKDGERFPLILSFQKAGEREVTAWVQQPRAAAGATTHAH